MLPWVHHTETSGIVSLKTNFCDLKLLVKIHSEGLTKLDALRLSIAMWKHIEATGVRKPEAMEALGMCSSDFMAQCPCCEYVSQRMRINVKGLQCEDHCPAWLEFSANFELGGGCVSDTIRRK